MFMQDPELLNVVVKPPPSGFSRLEPAAYYTFSICAHAYHMRERKVLGENEWAGWLQWMKNAFHQGTLVKYWKEERMDEWFDPAFRKFVNKELIPPNPTVA